MRFRPQVVALIPVLLLISSFRHAEAAEIPVVAPEEVEISSQKMARVDETLNGLVKQNRLAGGIVVVARRGKVVHFQSYGMADLEADRPMTNDAIMRFYSMSKAITSAGVMMLVDEGRLDVHDSVAKYIPAMRNMTVATADGFIAASSEVTIADLLRHTSGLTYGRTALSQADAAFNRVNPLDPTRTLQQMGERLGDVPLIFHPGEDWGYGISIDVLGRVIEVVSKQTLDEFFRKRIFEPLDMPDTGFFVPEGKLHRFAQVYNSDGAGNLSVGDNSGRADFTKPRAFLSGGGGLVSTARDYLRFLMMIQQGGQLDGKKLLSAESVRLMTTNQLPEAVPHIYFGSQQRVGVGFGFGFSVREKMSRWDPEGRVGEFGWGGMASTHYWVSPRDELIVITLEQTLPFSFMTEFAVKGLIYDAIEE